MLKLSKHFFKQNNVKEIEESLKIFKFFFFYTQFPIFIFIFFDKHELNLPSCSSILYLPRMMLVPKTNY